MADPSFTLMASTTASTKRRPAADDSTELFGDPATYIASLSCTPIDAMNPEQTLATGLGAPFTIYQTFVQGGLDIVAGDLLVVGSQEYDIRAIEPYEWTPDSDAVYSRLILEKAEI